jgi:cytochrome P450
MQANGQSDFVEGLASLLPTMMILSLLNVPLEDVDLINGWTARIGKNRGGQVTADMLDAHAALAEFRTYVADIVSHHRRSDDATTLVSALMGAAEDDRLGADELLATMIVLIFGGSDTTTALLANGLHALLARPDQWQLLRRADDDQIGTAVEELMRFLSPVQTTWRVTTQPTTVGDVQLPENHTVLLAIGAANRDASIFPDPDRLDLARTPNHHLAFGFGTHFCIGAALARMEAATVFASLARRFPELTPRKALDEVAWRGNVQFRTVASLDVELGVEVSA